MSERTLVGIDVSHWQTEKEIEKIITKGDAAFMMIKATEGRTYQDHAVILHCEKAQSHNMPFGFYHYARPENGNSPESEAYNFVTTIERYIDQAVLALDYEGKAHSAGGQSWALKWLEEVYKLTGVKPLFYCSESELKRYPEIAANDFGLWVAKWSSNPPTISPWKIVAMWQYSNSPWDKNIFYGSKEQFMKYAASEIHDEIENSITGTGCCGCCKEGVK